MDYTVHGILQASILEWVAVPFSRGSFETRSFTLQADFLPAKPQGKPKNTGVGSLFFLQGIFLTQELNWGLLHCRRILYQLSYQGSPQLVKNPPAIRGRPGFHSWVGKILWRRERLPTPVFLPGEFHELCGFCLRDIQRTSCPHFLPGFQVSDNYSDKGRKRCVL